MPKADGKSNGGRDLEAALWAAADKLRGTLDAAEYKHVVLGLIFLKYISDSFEDRREELTRLSRDKSSDLYVKDDAQRERLLEDKDEYAAVNVFWVPPKARWSELQDNAKKPHIAQVIDAAMDAIERANPRLRGVLPADYARRNVAAERLGELIDLVGSITLHDKTGKAKDRLGDVYQYFLGKFAAAEGKLGGEFFTPTCVVRLLVRMLEPYKGRVFDPCCGSSGMFVQSERFVEEHAGRIGDISIFGQESHLPRKGPSAESQECLATFRISCIPRRSAFGARWCQSLHPAILSCWMASSDFQEQVRAGGEPHIGCDSRHVASRAHVR